MGAYLVRTSSLNDKHSCQLFRMGLRDKTTPTSTTHLIRSNMSCAVATIFSSEAFLSSSISMANLSRLVAASFSSLALLSSSVSMANLSCLLATTFSSLRLLSNSLSLPRFNLLRVARHCFSWFSVSDDFFFPSCVFLVPLLALSFLRLILSLSFLCSTVSEALFALSFSFLSECFFFVHTKAALAYSLNE